MDLGDLFPPDVYRFDDSGKSPALFWHGGPFVLTAQICDSLVSAGRRLGPRNLRICLHADPDDPIQEMIVLTWKDQDIPPHYHPSKTESLHMIHGRMRVHLYSDEGDRLNVAELDARENSMISMPRGACHENEVISEYCLFHEIKLGPPAGPDSNVVPSWVQP